MHRSGKDNVDHGRNGTDDYANSVCGVLRTLSKNRGFDETYAARADDFVDLDAKDALVPFG